MNNAHHPIIQIDGDIVAVTPHPEHEFTAPTSSIAIGFGVSESTVKEHKRQHADELLPGKHFVEVRNPDFQPGKGGAHTFIHWTKRGVVRLGFFIRSARAKRFRDLAEDLVLRESQTTPAPDLRTTPEMIAAKIDAFQVATAADVVTLRALVSLHRDARQAEAEYFPTFPVGPTPRDAAGALRPALLYGAPWAAPLGAAFADEVRRDHARRLLDRLLEGYSAEQLARPPLRVPAATLFRLGRSLRLQPFCDYPAAPGTRAYQSACGKRLRRLLDGREIADAQGGLWRVRKHDASRGSGYLFHLL